ncbi:hypothetical protein J6590_017387 [Homalodisca vitripennis]|nr:hypothetical protein J6590_017387 [Homalodisca vitripennis]
MAGLELSGETVAALWLDVEEFTGSRTSSGGTETSVDASGNAGLVKGCTNDGRTWCAGGGQAEMLPSVHPTSWYDRQARPSAPGAARPRCCRQCIRHRGMTGRPDLVRRGRPGRDAAVVHPTSWYDRQVRPMAGAARPRCCRQCIRHRGMTGRSDLVRRGRPGRDAAVSASDIVV